MKRTVSLSTRYEGYKGYKGYEGYEGYEGTRIEGGISACCSLRVSAADRLTSCSAAKSACSRSWSANSYCCTSPFRRSCVSAVSALESAIFGDTLGACVCLCV